ncbi:quinol monooxygenase YgiN [Actinokineospora baliensis]|uniref:hypothetical protein n=1 Tax=Actinokineospora baliensis TaxID=547056 RepID=UPI00195A0FF1|nr:hypothetical protein [Actinokineospora baliensis]MBM7774995.1 quinol monooxygenase YgiN [Actinokineospora baliensis]
MTEASINSWWRLPTAADAAAAARGALSAMPRVEGLIRFAVLRSPTEPVLFLQSLWASRTARDHYVDTIASTARAAVDTLVPTIERDRSLTEIRHTITHTDRAARSWTAHRLPVLDLVAAHGLARRESLRLRTTPPPGLARATIGVTDDDTPEVVVVEEWADTLPTDAYLPFGVISGWRGSGGGPGRR